MLKKALPKGTDGVNAQYVFRTVRPADYSTPYDTMLKHGVQFTAVERQQNMFITVTVSLLDVFSGFPVFTHLQMLTSQRCKQRKPEGSTSRTPFPVGMHAR